MTAKKIVDKIFEDRFKLNLGYDSKNWFEMSVCETCSDKYHKWDSKAVFKYKKLDVKDNKILLLNKRGKVIKELTKENIVWIDKVYLCDRHIRVTISYLNFVKID